MHENTPWEGLRLLIRKAEEKDIADIARLLLQVAAVHNSIRPDLFVKGGRKYGDAQLKSILSDEETPVFVAEIGGKVRGYAFCVFQRHRNDGALVDFDALYVDDLCVDGDARGKGIGSALFEYVKEFARKNGCYEVTLNVWEGNDAARAFYEKQGMTVQKTYMELKL